MDEYPNQNLEKLHEDLMDAIENNTNCAPYEVGNMMIWLATKMLCDLAPNPLVAFKTILLGVNIGIEEHQKRPFGNEI